MNSLPTVLGRSFGAGLLWLALSLSSPLKADTFVDTTQADFEAGTATNVDTAITPGSIVLSANPAPDQSNSTATSTVQTFSQTAWAGQTFTAGRTGRLTRVSLPMRGSGTSGTTPDIIISIRATTGSPAVPTGTDLATATIPGIADGDTPTIDAYFTTTVNVTSGTTYAFLFRPVTNPSAGTYGYFGSFSPNSNPYSGGRRVTSANSGANWTADATSGGRDLIFDTYVSQGYVDYGNLVSPVKDSAPAAGMITNWTSLAWTSTKPSGTSVLFKVGASNSPAGPFDLVGPDGSGSTYFNTSSGASLSQFIGYRYLQYAAYLDTSNTTKTPTLQSVTLTYTSIVAPTPPTVTDPTSFSVADTYASLGGNVTDDGGTPLLEIGVVLSKASVNNDPLLGGNGVTRVYSTPSLGIFSLGANYLTPNTLYAYKAYAINGSTGYSDVAFFTTQPAPLYALWDSHTNASTLESLAAIPHDIVGQALILSTVVGNTNIPVTKGTAYVAAAADASYSNLRLTVTFWEFANYSTSGTTPAFSNSLASYSFDVGPVSLVAGEIKPVNFALPAPLIIPSAGCGITFKYEVDSGSGLVADQNLCPVIRYGANPVETGFPTVGAADEWGYYRNAGGETDGNFLGSSFQTNGQPNQALAFELYTGGPNLAPDISVIGSNSLAIANNSTGPDIADGTDFGDAVLPGGTLTKTFTIVSTGSQALHLTGTPLVTVDCNVPGDFTVITQPTSVTLAPDYGIATASTTFQIKFGPSTSGFSYATVTIANDSSNNSPFVFAIGAAGVVLPTISGPYAQNVGAKIARLSGNVTDSGGGFLNLLGVVYSLTSENPNPTIGGDHVTELDDPYFDPGFFSERATGLIPGETYSYAAFVINAAGTVYTAVDTFTTSLVALHDGADTTAAELIDGQNRPVDFGITTLGTPVTRSFTFVNYGGTDVHLTGLTLPAGYAFTGGVFTPVTVLPQGTYTFEIKLLANTVPGYFDGAFALLNDSADHPNFELDFIGDVLNAGAPDLTFGGGTGQVLHHTTIEDYSNSMALQSDGKIVLAGSSFNPNATPFYPYNNSDIAVRRYNADGSPDITFGINGVVTTVIGYAGLANKVVIQPDGKILIAGDTILDSGSRVFLLARYTTDGTLDSTFGTGGIATVQISSIGLDYCRSLVLQSTGKIVASGSSYESDHFVFSAARFNSNGTLDTTFGTAGAVEVPFTGVENEQCLGMAVQADDKVLLTGQIFDGAHSLIALLRLTADGAPDATFGTGGKVTTQIDSGDSQAADVLVQSDGKILVAGYTVPTSNSYFAVMRYNTDGTLDATFGTGGITTNLVTGQFDFGNSIALQADGQIVVGGLSYAYNGIVFSLARYSHDGIVDNTFGIDGGVVTTFTGIDSATAIAVQADGTIIQSGHSFDPDLQVLSVAMARFSPGLKTPVTTAPATLLTATGATLNGTVNPVGVITSAWFEYGLTTTYNITTADQPLGYGASILPVTAAITGLPSNTTYHYRTVAENGVGITYGADMSFTTSVASTNADLSALATTAGSISFNPGTISYSFNTTATAATVTPTAADSHATIEVQVNGGGYSSVTSGSPSDDFTLQLAANTIEVKVTAEDGVTTKTYTLNAYLLGETVTIGGTLVTNVADFGTPTTVASPVNATTIISGNVSDASPDVDSVSLTLAAGKSILSASAVISGYVGATPGSIDFQSPASLTMSSTPVSGDGPVSLIVPGPATLGSTFLLTITPPSTGTASYVITLVLGTTQPTPVFTSGGDVPPGITGSTWESLRSGMAIASSGALAFRGYLALGNGVDTSNYQGIWKSSDGTPANTSLVTRSGSAAPDTSLTVNALFDILPINPVINNAAQTSFLGYLLVNSGAPLVTTTTDTGVWSELGGTGMHLLLREGDAITGGVVSTIAPSAWITAGDSMAAFTVRLATGSALVRTAVSGSTVTVATLAREGDTAPGGGTFDSFVGNTNDPRMDAAGDVAFLGYLQAGGGAIWYQSVSGSMMTVAKIGQTASGLGEAFTAFERPTLASSSVIAFRAFTATGQSVFRGDPATPASILPVAVSGDTGVQIPTIPAGRKLWSIWSPFSASSGRVAFRASMVDTAGNNNENRAILADTSGTMTVIAKVGDTAPGMGAETFVNFDHPVIGDGNQAAFVASTNAGSVGLWREAAGGGALALVVKVGDVFTINSTPETVAAITIPGGSTDDRKYEAKTMDAAGHVLIHVTYASGKTGIILSVP